MGAGRSLCLWWIVPRPRSGVADEALPTESKEARSSTRVPSFRWQAGRGCVRRGKRADFLSLVRAAAALGSKPTAPALAIERGHGIGESGAPSGCAWLVDAGPFLITVQGTTFTVSWDASGEQLDLRMKEGMVSVTGPLSEGAITVRCGPAAGHQPPEERSGVARYGRLCGSPPCQRFGFA